MAFNEVGQMDDEGLGRSKWRDRFKKLARASAAVSTGGASEAYFRRKQIAKVGKSTAFRNVMTGGLYGVAAKKGPVRMSPLGPVPASFKLWGPARKAAYVKARKAQAAKVQGGKPAGFHPLSLFEDTNAIPPSRMLNAFYNDGISADDMSAADDLGAFTEISDGDLGASRWRTQARGAGIKRGKGQVRTGKGGKKLRYRTVFHPMQLFTDAVSDTTISEYGDDGLGKSWLAKKLKGVTIKKALAKITPSKSIIGLVAMVPGVGTAAAGVLTGARVGLTAAKNVVNKAADVKAAAKAKLQKAKTEAERKIAENEYLQAVRNEKAVQALEKQAEAKLETAASTLPPEVVKAVQIAAPQAVVSPSTAVSGAVPATRPTVVATEQPMDTTPSAPIAERLKSAVDTATDAAGDVVQKGAEIEAGIMSGPGKWILIFLAAAAIGSVAMGKGKR